MLIGRIDTAFLSYDIYHSIINGVQNGSPFGGQVYVTMTGRSLVRDGLRNGDLLLRALRHCLRDDATTTCHRENLGFYSSSENAKRLRWSAMELMHWKSVVNAINLSCKAACSRRERKAARSCTVRYGSSQPSSYSMLYELTGWHYVCNLAEASSASVLDPLRPSNFKMAFYEAVGTQKLAK